MLALPASEARIFYHLLAFFLIVLVPLSGWYASARLKADPVPGSRLAVYRIAVGLMLLASVAVFLLVPPATFFQMQIQNRGVTWLPSRELISALAIALVLLTALPVLLARKSGQFQQNFRLQLQQLCHLLPKTAPERLWFAIAGVCAGVSEEILYRGFLLHYLHVFPGSVNLAMSMLVACAVYGLVHLYQGFNGVLQTVLLGLGLCVLFLSTRSLILPIALHVLLDLRMLMVLPDASPQKE